MACLFGHKWDGCKCTRCGKVRDEGHRFAYKGDGDRCIARCVLCGKEQVGEHEWNGCTCDKCRTTRDEGHRYTYTRQNVNECRATCEKCRKFIYIPHDMRPIPEKCVCQCSRCGYSEPMHDYRTLPGKKLQVCSVCGQKNWETISMDELRGLYEKDRITLKPLEARLRQYYQDNDGFYDLGSRCDYFIRFHDDHCCAVVKDLIAEIAR